MSEKRTIAEISIDSRILYDRLSKMDIGESISYAELSALIGKDVQREARGNLNTARNQARREHGMVFGAIIGVGLKRLKDEEIVGEGLKTVKAIGRASRRAMGKLVCVQDFDAMPTQAQTKHNTMLSILGVMNAMARPKRIFQIEASVEAAQKKLPIKQTLEAFKVVL